MIPPEIGEEGDMEKRKELMTEWKQTEDGKTHDAAVESLTKQMKEQQDELNLQSSISHRSIRACPVSADGTFRLDDVYPGTWTLVAKLYAPRKQGKCDIGDPINTLKHDFTIDDIPGNVSDEPFELGTLEFAR